MMTRKHFNALASIIQSTRKGRICRATQGDDSVTGWNDALDTVVVGMSNFFSEENPNFDEHKFLIACQEWANELPYDRKKAG